MVNNAILIFKLSRRLKARLEALPGAEKAPPDKLEEASTLAAAITLLTGTLEAESTVDVRNPAFVLCHLCHQLDTLGATLGFPMPDLLSDVLSEALNALHRRGFRLPDHVRQKEVDKVLNRRRRRAA